MIPIQTTGHSENAHQVPAYPQYDFDTLPQAANQISVANNSINNSVKMNTNLVKISLKAVL